MSSTCTKLEYIRHIVIVKPFTNSQIVIRTLSASLKLLKKHEWSDNNALYNTTDQLADSRLLILVQKVLPENTFISSAAIHHEYHKHAAL